MNHSLVRPRPHWIATDGSSPPRTLLEEGWFKFQGDLSEIRQVATRLGQPVIFVAGADLSDIFIAVTVDAIGPDANFVPDLLATVQPWVECEPWRNTVRGGLFELAFTVRKHPPDPLEDLVEQLHHLFRPFYDEVLVREVQAA